MLDAEWLQLSAIYFETLSTRIPAHSNVTPATSDEVVPKDDGEASFTSKMNGSTVPTGLGYMQGRNGLKPIASIIENYCGRRIVSQAQRLLQQALIRAPPIYLGLKKKAFLTQKPCIAVEHFELKNAVRADGLFRGARSPTSKFVMVGAPAPDFFAHLDSAFSGNHESLA